MSVLVPFNECIARPDEGEKRFFLRDHLLNVKAFAENWVKEDTDETIVTLIGLAAICHDLAKSHSDWQNYIRNPEVKKGPTHAPAGAFLFSYLGYQWLWFHNNWENYRVIWIWLIRDIADHHGRLKSLSETHWIYKADWDKTDFDGIVSFLLKEYPVLKNVKISIDALDSWLEEIDDYIEELREELDLIYQEPDYYKLMIKLQRWRSFTTSLISGDRFHVSQTETSSLTEIDLKNASESLSQYCTSKSSQSLSKIRIDAQKGILRQLSNSPNQRFYTLEMPTGYGKTITALKMSLWFCENQNYHKIIYVAPYLSILEQTSQVIEEAMQIGVLEHHSLAILDKPNQKDTKDEQRTPVSQLAMESWAHSIICTSFQQWFKAIYPSRSQDVLRRAFLRESIVIIDEPQIFDSNVWNLFLIGLEALAEMSNLKVVFLSATMPPFKFGLSCDPKPLVVSNRQNIERYNVHIQDQMDEQGLAVFLRNRKERKQAAILNTIEDAYRVYQQLANDGDIRLLHGLMIPLHKNIEISKIQRSLSTDISTPLKVISTQIIEAGVDVSFHHVARALPILPSIVQAAGRVNRHNEIERGLLSVIPYFRGGKKDTRKSIYDHSLTRITDQLLLKKGIWTESEMIPLVKKYYDEMFRENTYETTKEAIASAYEGNWPELAKFQPFGQDYLKLPLFVPWNIQDEDKQWLPKSFQFLQTKFQVSDAFSIYDLYSDGSYLRKLSFEKRKQFMILFHHFVLNVPVKVALKFVSQDDYLQSNKIPILEDGDAYDQMLGLIGQFNDTDNII